MRLRRPYRSDCRRSQDQGKCHLGPMLKGGAPAWAGKERLPGAGACPRYALAHRAEGRSSYTPAGLSTDPAHRLDVLIAVADAVMRAAAVGGAQNHDQFVMAGRVGDRKLHGQVMRTASGVVLVHQGHLDLRAGGAADIGEAKIGLGPHRLAVKVAKAQGVDQGRAMLHLAIGAADGGFAIGLDRIATAGEGDQGVGQDLAQNGRDAGDFGDRS